MTRPLKLQVLESARQMASRIPDMLPEDQIPILFCPIDDLERVFTRAHDDVFFQAIAAAHERGFYGWLLSGVAERVSPEGHARNWYPFEDRMAEVLPWWRTRKSDVKQGGADDLMLSSGSKREDDTE